MRLPAVYRLTLSKKRSLKSFRNEKKNMRIDSYTVYYYVHFIRFIFSVFDLIFDLNLCNMHINTVTNYLRGTCGCGKSMSINRCLIRGMFHLYNNRNRTWFWHLVCIIFFIQQYQMNKKSLWKIRTNHIWKKKNTSCLSYINIIFCKRKQSCIYW